MSRQITVSDSWLEWLKNKALAGDCKGIVRQVDMMLYVSAEKETLDTPPAE